MEAIIDIINVGLGFAVLVVGVAGYRVMRRQLELQEKHTGNGNSETD